MGDDVNLRQDQLSQADVVQKHPSHPGGPANDIDMVIGRFATASSEVGGPGLGLGNTKSFPFGMRCVLTHDVAAWVVSSASMLALGFPEDGVMEAWLASARTYYISSDRFHDGDSEEVS